MDADETIEKVFVREKIARWVEKGLECGANGFVFNLNASLVFSSSVQLFGVTNELEEENLRHFPFL
jgi:hypothetical protein